jgi:hypothetical protein
MAEFRLTVHHRAETRRILHMDNDNDPNQPYISYELAEDESDDEEEFRLRQIAVVAVFALIPSTVSRYLHFSLKILLQTLRCIP